MSRPSLSTQTGDDGTTGLYGGSRVSKSSVRLHAYGDIDELNALIGVVLAENLPEIIESHLRSIQSTLFTVGSDLATPSEHDIKVTRISEAAVIELENFGITLEENLEPLKLFVLPSGSRAGSLLHQARTVCRRAERWIVELSEQQKINTHVLVYINRLSDYLFLAARTTNKDLGASEAQWIST